MVNLKGSKKRIQKHIDVFNEKLSGYLERKGYPLRPKRFVSRVFCYLRVHPELREEPDWKCLYEECLNYLVSNFIVDSNQKESPEKLRAICELIFKLHGENKQHSFEMTSEIVGDYLRYRKLHWLDEKPAFFKYKTAIKNAYMVENSIFQKMLPNAEKIGKNMHMGQKFG